MEVLTFLVEYPANSLESMVAINRLLMCANRDGFFLRELKKISIGTGPDKKYLRISLCGNKASSYIQ